MPVVQLPGWRIAILCYHFIATVLSLPPCTYPGWMATEQPTHPGSRGADPVTDGTATLEELNNLSTEVLRLYLTQANLVTTGPKKTLAARLHSYLRNRARKDKASSSKTDGDSLVDEEDRAHNHRPQADSASKKANRKAPAKVRKRTVVAPGPAGTQSTRPSRSWTPAPTGTRKAATLKRTGDGRLRKPSPKHKPPPKHKP